jgi:tetratricopeptide (TPR) repeat protein
VAAIDAFQAAVDADSQHKGAISELASIRKKMEKSTDRRRLNLSNYAYTRGTIAYLDRDWAKAWRVWSERLQVEPSNVVLANATARAESKFKKMMMTEQEDFFRRGARAFYSQGLYKESQASWTKVLALRPDDMEALEGKVRSEEAILRAEGKGRDNEIHDLLEQGLEYYASQNWRKSLQVFEQIVRVDPTFDTAKEYIAKLNRHLEAPDYIPSSISASGNWRENKPSNQGNESVKIPDNLENFSASKNELQSQLNRDPSNIRVQQELDRVSKMQEEKCEEIYKDGLIAYSQGNRGLAIQEWKKVLVMDPDHKKALAALRKAKAEDEREEKTAAAETQ